MIIHTKILEVIYNCANELNKQLPEDGRLKCTIDTAIIGNDSVLDSLGIVTLIVSIEEKIEELGIECDLMNTLMFQHVDVHPFRTMGSLASWVEKN